MKEDLIKGSEIKNVLTRFFYKNKNSCFQIILQTRKKDIIYKEFEDYKSYKNTIETLRTAKKDDLNVILSLKIKSAAV